MKRKSLLKTLFALIICGLFFVNANAQKGNILLGDYSFSVADNGTIPTSIANTGTEAGVSLNLTSPTAVTSRSKQGYSYAMKCSGIELSGDLSSIGSFEMAIQNGSSGNIATYTVSVYDGSDWIVTETIDVAGNADMLYKPSTVITKSAAKIKVTSNNSSWFYGVKVYNNTNPNDGTPAFVSIDPVENSNLPSTGSISVQFDELVKAGAGNITLGDATITNKQFKGNTLIIDYTGLTNMTNPLLIQMTSVTNYAGNELSTAVIRSFQIDITPPTFVSASPDPKAGDIHIGDLGEDARKIKLTFNENIKLTNEGTITFNNAQIKYSVTGSVLTISYNGLAYESSNLLIVPASLIADLSGNLLENDIELTYTTGKRDATPPTLVSQSVADNSNQSIGGSIYFTFDEIVQPGNANILINGEIAKASSNGKVIGVNYTNLPYSSNISVELPAGCVTDTCGNVYAGKTFAFNTVAKVAKAFDFVVAKDGSGDYDNITAAVAAASGTERTFIYVKKGTYSEKIPVLKDKVSLIGEDADEVIITWNECSSTSTLQSGTGISSIGTDASYTMLIRGNDFYGENFTVRNDYDYRSGTDTNKQAVALEHIAGDRHVLKNIKMYSFQDTYYPKSINTRQYLKDCYILGGTDFIFGSGTTFIDNATIDCFKGGQYITAASDTQQPFGIVLNECEIQYGDTATIGTSRQFYLGRPWKAPAKTSYINCSFEDGLIQNAGWVEWSGNDNHLSAVYSEYNSMLKNGTPMDVSNRVSWSSQLTADEAARFDIDNVFNFGTSSGSWNPLPVLTETGAPQNAVINESGVITWTAPDFAVGYLVFKNGDLFDKTAALTVTDSDRVPSDSYTVKASNEYGALSEAALVTNQTGRKTTILNNDFLKATYINNQLELVNPENFYKIELINLNGQIVLSTEISLATISVSSLSKGIYFVKGYNKSGELYVGKVILK